MPKLGDSRSMEGPGIVPAQDHRVNVRPSERSSHVATRVIDTMEEDGVRYHVDDRELRGDVQGCSVWEIDDKSTSPRACVMWRHAWPCVVREFGDGYTEDPPPPDSFPDFVGGPSTPGSGSGGNDGTVGGPGKWRRKQSGDWVWAPQPIGGSDQYSGPGTPSGYASGWGGGVQIGKP